jgi:hypothetical protein
MKIVHRLKKIHIIKKIHSLDAFFMIIIQFNIA